MTETPVLCPSTTDRSRHRRCAALFGLVVALTATALPTVTALAQTYDGRPPVLRQRPGLRGGGGGAGVGAAIGLGIGLLGAAAAANRAAAEEDVPPPRPGGKPRRVRVIENDEDPVPPPRRVKVTAPSGGGGGMQPPRGRSPKRADPPASNIRLPAPSETRYLAGEVLIEVRGGGRIEALARRLDLEVIGAERSALLGSTLFRVRARDGRSTTRILAQLQQDGSVAFAQPNWVYTLQQTGSDREADAAAPAEIGTAAAPSPAPTEAVPAGAGASDAAGGVATVPEPLAAPAAPGVPAAPAALAAPAVPEAFAAPAVPAGGAPEGGGSRTATAAAATAPAAVVPLPGQYAAQKLHLPAAHGRARGTGVLVAVIDTGADESHPELAGAVEASFDALEGATPVAGVHGTAMAGAVAARSRLDGAAPAARLLVARAFGPPAANGVAQGSTFHVVKCLDWAVARGARVVSMSFAGPQSNLLGRALEAAHGRGVISVAAAGNAGPQSAPLHPAADPGVIAVTASDPDDRVLPVANRGGHVLVTAPGVDVLVAAPQGGYDLTSGTSVAAAEVAGVVALLVEKRADLGPEEVRRVLATTAVDLGPKGRDPIFGAGLVDAEAAVAAVGGRAR